MDYIKHNGPLNNSAKKKKNRPMKDMFHYSQTQLHKDELLLSKQDADRKTEQVNNSSSNLAFSIWPKSQLC